MQSYFRYTTLGAHWYAKGLYTKERKPGSQIKAAKVYRVQEGDFVYNRLFAWKGSFAVASEADGACYVSNEFPCFEVNRDRIEPVFLWKYFSRESAWNEALGLSFGATPTSRNRLKEANLLDMTIPLPPLPEQRRIVAKIDRLTASIKKAQGLRDGAVLTASIFTESVRDRALTGEITREWRLVNPDVAPFARTLACVGNDKWPGHRKPRKRKPISLPEPCQVPEGWLVVTLGELQEKGAILDIQDGNHGSDYPRKSEFTDEGVKFVTAVQMDGSTVHMHVAPCLPRERAARLRIGFAKGGDVLLTHNASVGKVARAPIDAGDFLIGTSVTYYRCNEKALHPDYLVEFFRSGLFQQQLRWIMKQTTRNQVSVLKQVNLWICMPPLEEQSSIVTYLKDRQAEMDRLNVIQAQTAAELDALLPAVLEKAFWAEL